MQIRTHVTPSQKLRGNLFDLFGKVDQKKMEKTIEVEDYEHLFKETKKEIMTMPIGNQSEVSVTLKQMNEVIVALDEVFRSAGKY